jgi:uncharacterized membrane protein
MTTGATHERGSRVRDTRRRAALPIALLFGFTGVMHFVAPAFFLQIVPPWVPDASLAVSLSGVAEVAGAIGVLVRFTRRAAACGLILLLMAVYPANIQMLQHARAEHAAAWWQALLWFRLPLQPLMAWWIWKAAIRR